MKNQLINYGIVLFMMGLLFFSLLYKELVINTISYSLHLWVHNLIPSMFPFFVISDILIQYHFTDYIPFFIKRFFSFLFGVNYDVVTIFFLSCLSGFPSNARIILGMYQNGYISLDDANHALIFTHFSNPLFILSTVGNLFLHSEVYGYIILISHYVGNIILGIITRGKNSYCYCHTLEKKQLSFGQIFIQAIRSSIDTLLLILGIVTCFLVFSTFIIQMVPFNDYTGAIFKGIIEITMGLKSLSMLSISNIYKVVISSMFLSFGGISVHLQVYSQLIDTEISYHAFFVARIFHMIISGVICYILFLVI